MTGKKFEQKLVPGGKEICEKQLFNLVDIVEKVEVNHDQIDQFLPVIYKKLEWLDREELIKHFVSVEFNRFLEYYKNSRDLNVIEPDRGNKKSKNRKENQDKPSWPERADRPDRKSSNRQFNVDFARFFINVGQKNGLQPAKLIGLIKDITGKHNIEVGRIEIMKRFAFFEIDSEYSKMLLKSSKNAEFDNIQVIIEPSQPEPVKRNRDKKDESYFKGNKEGKRSGEKKRSGSKKFSDKKSFGSNTGKRKKY